MPGLSADFLDLHLQVFEAYVLVERRDFDEDKDDDDDDEDAVVRELIETVAAASRRCSADA